MSKITAFEYLVNELTIWNNDICGDYVKGLDKLKIIKLHFFVCAISSNEENEDLFEIFDNFHALPLGPVESDVYNSINNGELNYFQINKSRFSILLNYVEPNEVQLSSINKSKIKDAVSKLRTVNSGLIKYSAFELVDLSHTWSSWLSIFSFAKSLGKYSEKIPIDIIRKEHKIYSL